MRILRARSSWTESETGGLDAAAFSEADKKPEMVLPSNKPDPRFTGSRPVIVNIHGGPEVQSRPGFQGRSNYFYAELGVAVLYANVRGSTGFGKSFVKLDNGVLREDSVKDIGAVLIDWIPTRADLDAARVNIVGISSFVTFLQNTESYRRDLRHVEYGDERDPAMKAHLLRISPANHAEVITKPLLVVQGRNEPRVPWTESEQWRRVARSRASSGDAEPARNAAAPSARMDQGARPRRAAPAPLSARVSNARRAPAIPSVVERGSATGTLFLHSSSGESGGVGGEPDGGSGSLSAPRSCLRASERRR